MIPLLSRVMVSALGHFVRQALSAGLVLPVYSLIPWSGSDATPSLRVRTLGLKRIKKVAKNCTSDVTSLAGESVLSQKKE